MNKLLTIVAFLLTTSLSLYAQQFIGHRGCNLGVENTRAAYLNGAQVYQYAGLECDVRTTNDGYYVICHDPDLKRFGDSLVIADTTLQAVRQVVLQQQRQGVHYEGQICLVEEYLRICKEAGTFPVVELKWAKGINSNDMSRFDGLYQLICRYGLEDRVVILTSMLPSLEHIRQHYPTLHCQYLMMTVSAERFDACVRLHLEPSVQFGGLSQELIDRFHEAGLKVACWTVNQPDDVARLTAWGVDYITTDMHTIYIESKR